MITSLLCFNKKLFTFLGVAMFILMHCQAQKEENVWVFGFKAGVDFNSGAPVAFKATNPASDSIQAQLGTGSVCDTSGQLLFYTDGIRVWNRNHEIMPNGTGLADPVTLGLNAQQTGLIVPVPDQGNLYYIFSVNRYAHTGSGGTLLYYSVVDVTLDGGLGDVVAGQKKIALDSPTRYTEKITAVAGANCDVWVVALTHTPAPGPPVPEFKAWNITAGGINPTPVVSPAGPLYTDLGHIPYTNWLNGVLKFSPDRTRMAHTTGHYAIAFPPTMVGGLELFDFDPATGVLSNGINMSPGDPIQVVNGTAFSPDGSKLYATAGHWSLMGNEVDSVYQWDLSLSTPAAVVASKMAVSPMTGSNALAAINATSQMKLGPDGMVYFCYSLGNNVPSFLHRIESPNLAGSACNVVFNAIPLTAGTRASLGLPGDVAVVVPGDTIFSTHDTLVCSTNPSTPLLELKAPSGGGSIEWDDGSTDSVRSVQQTGVFWVRSTISCHQNVDTFVVMGGYITPASITADENILATTSAYNTYQWYYNGTAISGATDSSYLVDTNGVFSVRVTTAGGCTDSAWYEVTNVSVRDYNAQHRIVSMYPNPTYTKITLSTSVPLQDAQIKIVNAAGQAVLNRTDIKGNTFQLDIAKFPAGVYLVELHEDGEVVRLRLLKQ